jgi:oligopeptide/dipeptide ABC transporter ATP-binding protein
MIARWEASREANAPPAPGATATDELVLEVEALTVAVRGSRGMFNVVDGVSFGVAAGETLAIVGESGCGKSMTALSILRLNPQPASVITGGTIRLNGRDLVTLNDRDMRKVRGNDLSMIFQEPMTSLNPLLTIGRQVSEPLYLHQGASRREAAERAMEMLRLVHIPDPAHRFHEYPHQLSGGMRQRVMIAMALACNPKVLMADEPTTALDVTIQAQVLRLMREIQDRLGTAIVLITHDMGVVAENAKRVAVMYAGQVVEYGAIAAIFEAPLHPYTYGLLRSVPEIRRDAIGATERLHTIRGTVPSLAERPAGCVFHPRCPLATDICRSVRPRLEAQAGGTRVACHHSDRVAEMAVLT